MVNLPVGSLIGLCAIVLVLGVVVGRSSSAMSKIGRAHAAAHGGTAEGGNAEARGGHSDVRVQTVVVADPASLAGQGGLVLDRRQTEAGESATVEGATVHALPVAQPVPTWLDGPLPEAVKR